MVVPAKELIAHLKRHHRTTDFAYATLMFAMCERRLVEAKKLVRTGNEHMDMLQDEIRAFEA
jgi:hypothetical protein